LGSVGSAAATAAGGPTCSSRCTKYVFTDRPNLQRHAGPQGGRVDAVRAVADVDDVEAGFDDTAQLAITAICAAAEFVTEL
jgi:hypothetical protein